ncbi:MAG: DAK2 domain-containing protein, partial [Parasporobacterium sp.]|nr:DAK2 domain-containing protein [Parasporobacterium sp.]
EMFAQVLEHGDYVLSKTPDMLPVLKQAGVVDSGGQGLMEVLKGAYDALVGNSVDYEIIEPSAEGGAAASFNISTENIDTSDIKFGYCTEFIILLEKEFTDDDELEFKKFLMSIGDSLVCVPDDEIVKIHVHTNDPGVAIQKALTYGQLTKLKIDNMRLEHKEKLFNEAQKAQAAKEEEQLRSEMESAASSNVDGFEIIDGDERKAAGFVTVSMGEGLDEIFKSLGVDYIISGGQTNNPSTEDMLNAITKVNADTIYIFPNNSNIILAANQAKELTEDKEIAVVPSKTVPQGIAALIEFIDGKSTEDNLARMTEAMANVKSGSVTYAVRDTVIDDKEIKENDIMGIGDAGIISVGKDIKETTLDMISHLVDDDSELISIYFGEDVNEDTANELGDAISAKYPDVDVEVNPGGQPIYYYLISVE